MSFSAEFREKMAAEGLHEAFIEGWLQLYEKFCNGDKGFIPESAIEPVTELPELDSLPEGDEGLLAKTVVLKLNGGLGTGMGLDKAKSLLEVKDGDSFLDLIAKQILKLREKYPVRFMLMNSFSTEEDTKEFFTRKYPEIAAAWDQEVSFMQNMSPKVDAETKQPVSWPAKPSAEWCPPGHGDIYAALVCSGKLDQLIADGYEYLFVSNSDNLGATMDLRLLGYLAETGAPMLMEVCVRGEDDKKGGHLARQVGSGILTLRESAQCPKEDEKAFQDIGKHKFFNTNNLWLNLLHLRDAMVGGVMPLPIIVNEKKVDPSSKEDPGPKVFQLETAMGAAISSMPGSQAICVPFSRFAPVKTCNQLFALRSDAYTIDEEFKPVLAQGACKPVVDFDDNYKMVPDMEAAIPQGVPSLKQCKKVTVRGKVVFAANVVIIGDVSILNGEKTGPAPTITGTIKGSSDKLRILRDADDVQCHIAGQGGAQAQTGRTSVVSRTLTGTTVGLPTYRTSMPVSGPSSALSLSNTMRALPTAPAVLGPSSIPQVVKTMQAPVRQVIAPQVASARGAVPMASQVISSTSPAPIVAPQIIAATSPAATPAAAPIAYSKAGPSWVAPPRYVMAAQPSVQAVMTARS
mmetsp:Transcript_115990/g.333092  ORF Transcript_115990/g.333092 Transcript_115990/m.333092 type:complete len:631 (+) Transcript_115990:53-1945(+)